MDALITMFDNNNENIYDWTTNYVLTRIEALNGWQKYNVIVESINFIDNIITIYFDENCHLDSENKNKVANMIQAHTGYKITIK